MKRHKRIPLVYLASPYSYESKIPFVSALVKYARYVRITRIGAKLTEERDIALICPITQSHQLGKYMVDNDGGFDRWRTVDLSYIAKCDQLIVVKMAGWEESIGVQEEIKYAKRKKIPIEYIDDPFDDYVLSHQYLHYPIF
jgi:hypothetical protein